ncbi:Glucose-methanol-choline (GMC) oxidoreductase:NAD binding site [[Actinomadura] parvosata subsp. kistnae]|uniref:GMC family oxidoreductase N-terminal domain-containing protein n=1 Tax=[Actinomadura] parvosata TaxID=1955412 RepID=UPI000D29A4A3|nr:Glucose-methanol-choline (GMC) oxidoreductase:NAD binding site [Actinomadura parvosata subsp. kistnae]
MAGLDDLLTEAERLLAVTSSALADAPLADLVRKRLAEEFDDGRAPDRRVRPMPLAVRRTASGELIWSGSDVVFGEVTRRNANFRLLDESLVTRVLVQDGAVRGVRVRDLRSGHEHVVGARFTVVAADSLRTPQVLHASGVRPPPWAATSTTSRRSSTPPASATPRRSRPPRRRTAPSPRGAG